MKEQSAAGILETTIEKVKNLANVSPIIGDPMTVEGGNTTKRRRGKLPRRRVHCNLLDN